MWRRVGIIVSVAVLLVIGAAAPLSAQSTTTGGLRGAVVDTDGGALPGVSVTVTSGALVAGRLMAVTDGQGNYRFPSLPPGVYVVEAELSGFRTSRQENVRVALGQVLAVNITMPLAAAKEEITVTGEAPLVSTVTNSVAANFDETFLQRQPLSRSFNALMNFAPGVNNMNAYGGTQNRQNAYNLDGVSVRNPASGGYWLLPSVDWLQEIQIGGLAANAEYGGYTGAVYNAITKSGGNVFQGDLTFYYANKSMVSDNSGASQKPEFSYQDVSLSAGGAMARDKAWYFVSANVVKDKRTPVGAKTSEDRDNLRFLAKATMQLDTANRLVILGDYDGQTTEHRGVSALTLPSATLKQDSPNYTYNVSWEGLLNASNFVSAKVTGFNGRDDRTPYNSINTPGHYDSDSGIAWGNPDQWYKQHYQRQSVDLAWNLFVDGLFAAKDSHTFKFGINYENAKSVEDYWRVGGFTYYDDSYYCKDLTEYFADPMCGVYSADYGDEIHLQGKHNGWAAYAQDSLKLARVTVNVGVRYGAYKGGFSNGKSDVYDVNFTDPRLGVVWDVFGTSRTALKAHFGRFHEGMFTYLYDREASGKVYTPYYYCDYNFKTGKFDKCSTPGPTTAAMDANLKHPYVDQWVATFEQQLTQNTGIGVDYINRRFRGIVAQVNTNNDYDSLVAPGNPLTGGSLPFYDLLSSRNYLLTNPAGAYRDFNSVVVRFDKRYADGWALNSSFVWADLKGNSSRQDSYDATFNDKNGQTNAIGKLPAFSKYEFKLNASVDLPANFQASANYTYRSGEYWTPTVSVRGLYKNDPQTVFLTTRGSEQLPARNLVDLRLSWKGQLARAMSLGVFLDAFNVLNADTATGVTSSWGRYNYNYKNHPAGSTWKPSSSFKTVTSIENPRELRLGVRLSF